MKKLLLAVMLVLGFTAVSFAVDSQVWQPYGQMNEAGTPQNYAFTVSSYTVQMSTAVDRGVQRIFVNNSTNTLYYKYTNGTSVADTGLPLYSHEHYIEDRYFGDIYWLGEKASTTSNLRIGVIVGASPY